MSFVYVVHCGLLLFSQPTSSKVNFSKGHEIAIRNRFLNKKPRQNLFDGRVEEGKILSCHYFIKKTPLKKMLNLGATATF